MRKIYIFQLILLATCISLVILYQTKDVKTEYMPHTTPQVNCVDAEKEQLRQQLSNTQQEIIILRHDKDMMEQYWMEFFEPAQIEYMKRRGKK